MKILLDTHVLLWAMSGEPAMSPKMVYYLEDLNNTLFYSLASVWEISIKHRLHPEALPISAEEFLRHCD